MGSVIKSLELLFKIFSLLKGWMDFIERNKEEQWFKDSAAVFARVKNAETQEQKKAAIRDLAKLWAGV